jgi:hypothetical protein
MNIEIGKYYIYRWKNNEKRKLMYGQRCKVLALLRLNSALVRFDDGHEECVSRYALKEESNERSR